MLFKFLDGIAAIILFFEALAQIFLIPAIFLVLGLVNSAPWQYYAITIGGYFCIAIVLQIILHFVFKKIEKRAESAFSRFIEKMSRNASNHDF